MHIYTYIYTVLHILIYISVLFMYTFVNNTNKYFHIYWNLFGHCGQYELVEWVNYNLSQLRAIIYIK